MNTRITYKFFRKKKDLLKDFIEESPNVYLLKDEDHLDFIQVNLNNGTVVYTRGYEYIINEWKDNDYVD